MTGPKPLTPDEQREIRRLRAEASIRDSRAELRRLRADHEDAQVEDSTTLTDDEQHELRGLRADVHAREERELLERLRAEDARNRLTPKMRAFIAEVRQERLDRKDPSPGDVLRAIGAAGPNASQTKVARRLGVARGTLMARVHRFWGPDASWPPTTKPVINAPPGAVEDWREG